MFCKVIRQWFNRDEAKVSWIFGNIKQKKKTLKRICGNVTKKKRQENKLK
jgi:hypothetical protein